MFARRFAAVVLARRRGHLDCWGAGAVMRVTVVRPTELGPSEAESWAQFQQSSLLASNPFYSLTYIQAVGRARATARIAVVEDDGKIVAFIPYKQGEQEIAGPIDGLWTTLDGLISSNTPFDVRSAIRQAGLRGWRFLHAPAEQDALAPYRYGGDRHVTDISFIDLSTGYDAYIGGMSQAVNERISRTARYRRALGRKVGPVTLDWNSSNPENLDRLLTWKSAQHDSVRQWLSDPVSLEFVRNLAFTKGDDCAGIISVLSAGERPVAILLSLRRYQTLSAWFTAYDPDFARFSAGTIKWLAVAEEAAGQGVTRIDLGWGENRYKDRLGNASYAVSGGAVWASRAEATGRSIYRRLRYRR
jgi:CelD/BcsL family acetyltransferase involved in cellulose biosynthesis